MRNKKKERKKRRLFRKIETRVIFVKFIEFSFFLFFFVDAYDSTWFNFMFIVSTNTLFRLYDVYCFGLVCGL